MRSCGSIRREASPVGRREASPVGRREASPVGRRTTSAHRRPPLLASPQRCELCETQDGSFRARTGQLRCASVSHMTCAPRHACKQRDCPLCTLWPCCPARPATHRGPRHACIARVRPQPRAGYNRNAARNCSKPCTAARSRCSTSSIPRPLSTASRNSDPPVSRSIAGRSETNS
jgi:hypothetical protein